MNVPRSLRKRNSALRAPERPPAVYPRSMADQIVLAWTVDVTNTSFGPAQAAAALAAVPLYTDAVTDPVLGQNFGLTVASDATTTPSATTAKRTLTLNMTHNVSPTAPPPFPCHPRTTTPPTDPSVTPYPFRKAVTLPGSFFVALGATSIPTTMTQIPSIPAGTSIQFLSQVGVFYTATPASPTSITISPAYSGPPGNTGAFKEVAAPVALDRFAVYSSSDLDTDGVATVPPIPAGSGARILDVTYNDSTGGQFTAEAHLTGRRPVGFTFNDPSSLDVAEIVSMSIVSSGPFSNSVGQITLVELSDALPTLRADTTPGTGVGAGQGDNTFLAFTDAAQLLIDRALVYMPPSYFAVAFQQLSAPQLEGDFLVTTGSKDVPTTVDQATSVLNPSGGDTLRFASQMDKLYTTAAVTPKIVTLTEAYSGLDYCFTDPNEAGTNSNAGTRGNIGTKVINKMTAAMTPITADIPSNDQLAGPLAQFVNPGNAAPPPIPHTVDPATMTPALVSADYLSGIFTRTLQLALAVVPITSSTITFA